LELYIVKLSNSKAEPIERDVEHGEYESPYMPLGRAIDVYTEHERWPGYLTDVIGEKLNTWADSYAPQENVTVFALVTYGGDAVPNKPVIFEIQGPNNITFRRTTFTNSLGIANATFRIPWLQEYGDLVLGNWSVYASVDIAEITVSDTVYFKVGWIFDITDITLVDSTYSTAKSSIKKGEYAHFNITVRGISVVIRSAVVTVVIYDDLGVPIGFATWNGTFSGSIGDVKAGGYTEVVMNFQIYIPTGAFVGIGTAYANIYTELPSVGGAPYCPEESTTFSLEAAS